MVLHGVPSEAKGSMALGERTVSVAFRIGWRVVRLVPEPSLFGEDARVGAGPAALALHTGAALMPVTLWFDGDGWRVHVHPEIPVPASGARAEKVASMTQQLAAAWPGAIAEHPQDWHMLQKVFASDLGRQHRPSHVK